jgi:hypothetical protein
MFALPVALTVLLLETLQHWFRSRYVGRHRFLLLSMSCRAGQGEAPLSSELDCDCLPRPFRAGPAVVRRRDEDALRPRVRLGH